MLKGIVITNIPKDFIDRKNSSKDEYYPEGVVDNTNVIVIINRNGRLSQFTGVAQSFGWFKKPNPSSTPGIILESAPITHYKIENVGSK